MIDDKYSNERDQTGDIKEDDLESEESGTDEREKIENTKKLKRIFTQQNKENDDLVILIWIWRQIWWKH